MDIQPGQLVEHPTRPQWGPGKVLRVERDQALVFFVDAGPHNGAAKNPIPLVLSVVALKPASVTKHPRLDNLAPLEGDSVTGDQTYVSLAQGISHFLHLFPGGLASEAFHEGERGYKWAAHLECARALGKRDFARLLQHQDYEEIAQRARHIISMVNLLASFEVMALNDALKSPEGQRRFAGRLFDLLHGDGAVEDRFTHFAEALMGLPQKQSRVATWPIQTILPFLYDPSTHMFLKPGVTQQAALRCAFDLKYEAKPNWITYGRLLKLCDILFHELRDLRPRDYIDLQSFIWCIGDDSYRLGPLESRPRGRRDRGSPTGGIPSTPE